MPRLTFIIPVYRPDIKLLHRTATALKEQSLRDCEIIYVLDGPCPEAEDVLKRAIPTAKVIQIEHGGAPRARNEGFKHATSDIIIFFDCDCVIESGAALGWADSFDSMPDIGFIYSGYKYLDEGTAPYLSEEFDPWLLRVNNFISGNFPLRRKYVPQWNESLKSLQDWDFWLSVIEKGAKGLFLPGFSWATAAPNPNSISGKGCTPANWMERLNAVKALHNIPIRDVCVSSMVDRFEGIRLAKLIDADYRDFPRHIAHSYKTIIQLGWDFRQGYSKMCSEVFDKKTKNILFWNKESIEEFHHKISVCAAYEYSKNINTMCKQYVEDIESKRILAKGGFNTEVLPLPLINNDEISPLPEKPKWLLDVSEHYNAVFRCIDRALPDIELDKSGGANEIGKYTGIIHFRRDATMGQGIKRMILTGRHVVSNIKQPFAGFIEDNQSPDTFIPQIVNKIRKLSIEPVQTKGLEYYKKVLGVSKFKEAVLA